MLGTEWMQHVPVRIGRLMRHLGRELMVRPDMVDCWCQQRHLHSPVAFTWLSNILTDFPLASLLPSLFCRAPLS